MTEPKKLETLRDVQDFAALFRASEEAIVGTSCIRTLGPEKWQALVEVRGTPYRVDVARYARREYPWSWEVSAAGTHVRGGDERTLEDVGTCLARRSRTSWRWGGRPAVERGPDARAGCGDRSDPPAEAQQHGNVNLGPRPRDDLGRPVVKKRAA